MSDLPCFVFVTILKNAAYLQTAGSLPETRGRGGAGCGTWLKAQVV